MGMNADTVTQAADALAARYEDFRDFLPRHLQPVMDEAICRVRRNSASINRRPALDFERPSLMVLVLELMHEVREQRERTAGYERILVEAGLIQRRPRRSWPDLARCGQRRLEAPEP